MKIKSLAAIMSTIILLLAGFACGGGQGAAPTPTATPTTSPTATVVIATPTATYAFCPPPGEGKGNIAGIILWNGGSWVDEFHWRAGLELFPADSFYEMGGLRYLGGAITARTTADLDGNFCFRNIEPGEYFVRRDCPTTYSGVYINVTVTEGETYWLAFDPYYACTNPFGE